MSRRSNDTHEDWAAPLGACLVLVLIISLAFIASGGWQWFASFFTSSASGWAQAVGTVAAIIATGKIARRDQIRREENDLVIAEFTASKITGVIEPFHLQLGHISTEFWKISRVDVPKEKFSSLLNDLRSIDIEQLLRLAPVPRSVTHDLIDSIVLARNMSKQLEMISKHGDLERSEGRRHHAKELHINLFKAHELGRDAHAGLLGFLKERGVAMHNLSELLEK